MQRLTKFFLIICSCLFISCASVDTFVINVQKPAYLTIPSFIEDLAVVNNTIPETQNLIYDLPTKGSRGNLSIDSLNLIFRNILSQSLTARKFFDKVKVCPDSLQQLLKAKRLSNDNIFAICDAMNANAILSLDKFKVKVSQYQQKIEQGYIVDSLKVNIYSEFNVYDIYAKKRTPSIILADSSSWNEVRFGKTRLTEGLPSINMALKEATINAAYKMQPVFLPYWEEQKRWVYTNLSPKMQQAQNSLYNNNWADAISIWRGLYLKEQKPKIKSQLASNIALGYELSDDLQSANKWIKICLTDMGNNPPPPDYERAIAYKKELNQRIIDFKILDKQIGGSK